MFLRLSSLFCLLTLFGLPSGAQEPQHWTERRNLGFEGPVRSALTTVVRPNPDPRPPARRKLMVQANPDWAVFDIQGRRSEFASASSRDGFEAISNVLSKPMERRSAQTARVAPKKHEERKPRFLTEPEK